MSGKSTVENVFIEFICPDTKQLVKQKIILKDVIENDVTSCECCGNSVKNSLYVKCEDCGDYHTLSI